MESNVTLEVAVMIDKTAQKLYKYILRYGDRCPNPVCTTRSCFSPSPQPEDSRPRSLDGRIGHEVTQNPMQDNVLAATDDQTLIREFERRFPPEMGRPYPAAAFMHLVKYFPSVTAEAFIARRDGDDFQILVVDRKPSDIAHQGTCHMAGTFHLNGETFSAHIMRTLGTEVGLLFSPATFVGLTNDPYEPRGHHVHQIYNVELREEPVKGRWVRLLDLPSNLVLQHLPMIHDALSVYLGLSPAGFESEYQPTTKSEIDYWADWYHQEMLVTAPNPHEAARARMCEVGERQYWQEEIGALEEILSLMSAPTEDSSNR